MLKECIEVFEEKSQLNADPDKIILDNYIPADGTYIIVKPDGSYKHYEIKFNKKTKQLENIPLEYEKICFFDYHSRLVNMDKPQDPKKIIHSNNYLSLWVKKESFQNGKFNKEAIKRYFSVLKAPLEKYKKPQDIKLYKLVEQEVGIVDLEKAESNQKWICDNIFNLKEQDIPMQNKDYLKIFFEDTKENYIAEEQRYLYVKLFNNNDYNIEVNGNILGLPANNIGYNAKKPYLENLSKKINVSNLVTAKEALTQKRFFEYLMNQATLGKNNIYIDLEKRKIFAMEKGELPDSDFTGMFLQVQKGTEAEIWHQDSIVAYKPTLTPLFHYVNVLKVEDKDNEYKAYNSKKVLQEIINQVFFSKSLVMNYFTEVDKLSVPDTTVKECLLKARDAIFSWLYKGQNKNIEKVLHGIGIELVKKSISAGRLGKASRQFNLAISFKEYNRGGMGMAESYDEISGNLRRKLNVKELRGNPEISSDKEYFFAVGQLLEYFISLSKAKDKPHSLANPFFNMKDNSQLRKKLKQMFLKYNHEISTTSKRFKRLYGMISRYEEVDNFDTDQILAGYLSENLIYEKVEKEDSNNE